ncbi:hypothetical protein ACVIU7_003975 [Bradyrhizobium liaoningense]
MICASLSPSSCLGKAVPRTAPLPLAYARASTHFFFLAKTWMAGTSPAMMPRKLQVLA